MKYKEHSYPWETTNLPVMPNYPDTTAHMKINFIQKIWRAITMKGRF
jgi:hypothetical protein